MKNWKTTVAGMGAGLAGMLATALEAYANGTPLDTHALITSAGVMLVGYLAQDAGTIAAAINGIKKL